MRTEAIDLPAAEDRPAVTRGVGLAEAASAPSTMTVKQEAEAEDEEDQQLLCGSPVLPCGGERHPGAAERAPLDTRYGIT
jgi:hypothetical protein